MQEVIMRGIDVSRYQKGADFKAIKAAGKDFVILKAAKWNTKGPCAEPTFEEQYKAAKAAGLHVGAYSYTYAVNTSEAVQEARFVIQLLADKQLDMGVWYDMEYEPQILALSNQQRTDVVAAFLSTLEAAGHYCGLYASADFINNRLNYQQLSRFDIWAAQYGKTCTSKLPFSIWQTNGSPVVRNGQEVWPGGKCPGVNGWCDLDVCYKDLPTIIKGAGLCGYPKSEGSHPGSDGDGDDGGQHRPPESEVEVLPAVQLWNLQLGPMTGGDKVTFENMAHALGIPVKAKKA